MHWFQIWPLYAAPLVLVQNSPNGATWICSKFYHHLAPLELVANLATRWRHLSFAGRQFCHMKPRPLFSNIGHHMKILAMIANLFNGWCHLHQLQIWPPSGTTCIGSTFSHQVAPLALFPKLATRSRHLHCYIALAWIAYWHYQLVLSWYLHQPESHQLSFNNVSHSLSERQPDP